MTDFAANTGNDLHALTDLQNIIEKRVGTKLIKIPKGCWELHKWFYFFINFHSSPGHNLYYVLFGVQQVVRSMCWFDKAHHGSPRNLLPLISISEDQFLATTLTSNWPDHATVFREHFC